MVQFAAHRPQASLDIAKTLAVSQLSEGHCQILVATREASVVRVTPIAGDTLLKLVGGQMLHELGKDSLAEIHLSLSTIAPGSRRGAFGTVFAGKSSNRKNQTSLQPSDSKPLIESKKSLAGQQ